MLKHRYLCLFTVYNNIAVITNINYSILSIVISMMQHFNGNLIISLIMKLVTQLLSYYYCYYHFVCITIIVSRLRILMSFLLF